MSEEAGSGIAEIERATQIKRLHQDELLSKRNVVGVGIGFRQVKGERTQTVALIVMVSEKVPVAQLEPKDEIPRELDGIPVDVQIIGRPRAN